MAKPKGDIGKLPKWAQEYITDIERERDVAIRALNGYADSKSESPYYYDDWLCTGEEKGPSSKRIYVQTYKIDVEHAGVHLSVMTVPSEEYIRLTWEDRKSHGDVALIPTSYMNARLVSRGHMWPPLAETEGNKL